MDKTKLGLTAAVSALLALPGAAFAAPDAQAESATPPAQSYADLFQPIPNAVEKLRLSDMQEAQRAQSQPRLILAQNHHHHHHHHHQQHHHHHHKWWPF
jgi:hypothetical protein